MNLLNYRPLSVIVLLALIAAAWGAVRAWKRWGHPVVQARVVEPVRARLAVFSTSIERSVGTAMREALEGVTTRGPETRGLVASSVERWARALPTTVLWQSSALLLVFLAVDFGPIPHDRASLIESFRIWWGVVTAIPDRAVDVWEDPGKFLPLRFIFFCLMYAAAVRVWWPVELARTGGESMVGNAPRQSRRREAADAAALNWPVVALTLCAIQCGRAYRELERQTQSPGGVSESRRVSVKRAEKVIERAWRTRFPAAPIRRVRRHQRKELKRHAGQVVAALRTVEARQYRNPAEALPELATMLLVIAERYAQGRVLQLLDDEHLAGVRIAHDWGWLRLLLGGALITAALVGLSHVGLPGTATGPMAGLLITIVLTMVYRGRLPGLGDLIDIARGADRR
ncbi:hypothetical protein [Streptomyces coeruleorubidus]|uniref:hypothetical protein n=1 Tax=Streptomyces coeruleorubidus TaxID=116188 RepID=UPI00368F4354